MPVPVPAMIRTNEVFGKNLQNMSEGFIAAAPF